MVHHTTLARCGIAHHLGEYYYFRRVIQRRTPVLHISSVSQTTTTRISPPKNRKSGLAALNL